MSTSVFSVHQSSHNSKGLFQHQVHQPSYGLDFPGSSNRASTSQDHQQPDTSQMVPPVERTAKAKEPSAASYYTDGAASAPSRLSNGSASPPGTTRKMPPALRSKDFADPSSSQRALPSPPPSDDAEDEAPPLLTASPPRLTTSPSGMSSDEDGLHLQHDSPTEMSPSGGLYLPEQPPSPGHARAVTVDDSLLHRARRPSEETTASTLRSTIPTASSRISRPPPSPDATSLSFVDGRTLDEKPSAATFSRVHMSPDGHLQPPPSSRMPRRNTIGSGSAASSRPSRSLLRSHQSTLQPGSADDTAFAALDDDILQQAEAIRRERLSKRVKAQQPATEVNPMSTKDAEPEVLVGNLIGEGHVNYVLMYNMLTGIRTAVSRCQAKIRRPLTDEDYTAANKYSFDIVGNELTPSAKYDFKFKDYAPWVFRVLREDHFNLDPADYLLSLTAKYILSELGSPGKSGSFFYFSRDYRFIIKTIHHSEHKYLLSILKDYHAHVRDNPHTLISRFYGLHRVKLPRGRKIHFVIMNNLFPPHRDIHETYDLKGSTVGREYPEEKARENPKAVLKDLNWINRGRTLELGPMKRALFEEQLRRDTKFLQSMNVMDYSLLIGIHNMQRGNRDNLRRNTLRVFQPDFSGDRPQPMRRKMSLMKAQQAEAKLLRRAMRQSDPRELTDREADPTAALADRQHLVFYQDEGGMRATDEANGDLDTIYYLGVIDILTPYNSFKKVEHLWKGMSADRHKISPVPPLEYGNRFLSFLHASIRGGGGTEKFKPGADKEKTE